MASVHAANWAAAARLTGASAGVCTDTGIYWGDVSLPLLEMYVKGVRFETGRVDARPAMPAVLDLILDGRLNPAPMVARTVTWEEAPDAWAAHEGRLVVTRG